MYLAEALVALDRIADAVQHLNPDAIIDVSTTLPEQKQQDLGEQTHLPLTLWTPLWGMEYNSRTSYNLQSLEIAVSMLLMV